MTDARSRERVLVVDDEPSVLSLLEIGLTRLECELFMAGDGNHAISSVREVKPDLILLDILLPDLDGYEVCRQIRQLTTSPVILLTALRDGFDHVRALEAGADEHVSKPFSVAELRHRVNSALERARRDQSVLVAPQAVAEGRIYFGGKAFCVDLVNRLAFEMPHRRRPIPEVVPLSNCGYQLLTYLAANADRRVTYHELLERVWGSEWASERDLVRAHLSMLRLRLEVDSRKPRLLVDDGDGAVRLKS